MGNKSKTWAVLIILLLLIFVGIGAAVLGIYYIKNKVNQVKNNIPNEYSVDSKEQIYKAPDGSWSINYPQDWQIRDLDGKLVSFSADGFSNAIDKGKISILLLPVKNIDDLKEDFKKAHDDAEIRNIATGNITGVQMEGVLNANEPSMYPPGTPELITYFTLNNGNMMLIELIDFSQKATYNRMLTTLLFNQSTSKPTGNDKPKNISTGKKSESGNITVVSPHDGETITSPYLVTGQARVFENVVNYKLTDERGQILAEGIMNASAPDIGQFGPFSESINFIPLSATKGTLEVYALSPKDGEPIDVVKIDVKF